MTTDTIEREVLIQAPVDRVWSMITEAEHLGAWFGEAGADIDLRPGGALEVRWDGHSLTGVVAVVDPTRRFAFRWRQIDGTADANLADGNSTLVEFSLEREGEATRVRLVESGFAALDLSAEDRSSMHESHAGGWPLELGDLEAYAPGVVV